MKRGGIKINFRELTFFKELTVYVIKRVKISITHTVQHCKVPILKKEILHKGRQGIKEREP